MRQVNIHEAKTHLSRLIDDAVGGESFVIAKAGKPLVKVTAIAASEMQPQRIGFLKEQFELPDDFDTMDQDAIIALFESAQSKDGETLSPDKKEG